MSRHVSRLVSWRASWHLTGRHLASGHLTGLFVGGFDDKLTVLEDFLGFGFEVVELWWLTCFEGWVGSRGQDMGWAVEF